MKYSFAKENNCEHIYTSAKTGEGLEEIFNKVSKQIAKQMSIEKSNTKIGGKGIKITNDPKEYEKNVGGGCC